MLQNNQNMSIHLANALARLKENIQSLATLAKDQVEQSFASFLEDNSELAHEVITRDDDLDRLEVDLEEECLKILALYQPVAQDLRFVVSVLKLANVLERIGDYGVHIAERAVALAYKNDFTDVFDLREMATLSLNMFQTSIHSLMQHDSVLARSIWELDREVDRLHKENFIKFENAIQKHPEKVNSLLQLLSVSRYLERIADLATNVADDVIYMVEGKILRHSR